MLLNSMIKRLSEFEDNKSWIGFRLVSDAPTEGKLARSFALTTAPIQSSRLKDT